MLKLVNSPISSLGADGGKIFHELIQASLDANKDYYKAIKAGRNLLKGDHWDNLKKKNKASKDIELVINLASAHVRSLVPTVYFQDPVLDCQPTSEQHAGKEGIWNSLINNILSKIGFSDQIKRSVLDAAFMPDAAVKLIVSKSAKGDNKKETETGVVSNSSPSIWLDEPTASVVRLNPAQIITDYLVPDRDLSKCRFVAIRYRKPAQEIINSPLYKGKVSRIAKDYVTSSQPINKGRIAAEKNIDDWDDSVNSASTLEEIWTIYEVWIKQYISQDGKIKCYEQMCTLLEEQDEPIRELTKWEDVLVPGFSEYPIQLIAFNPVPDTIPNSEVGVWAGMQYSMNWLISRATQLVENDRLIYLFDPTKVNDPKKFKEQFYRGGSRELVELKGGEMAESAVHLVQPTFVGRDNYTLINLMSQYIQQVSGFGQNRRGGSGIRTAREAGIIEQGTQLKTDEKVDTVKKFLEAVLTKLATLYHGLIKQSGKVNWVIKVAGDGGSANWLNFTIDDVDWLPEIRVVANSYRKQDTMQDMQKWSALIQIGMQLRATGVPVKLDELYARLLRAIGIYDVSKITGNRSAQEMMQMVEISAMMANQQVNVNEGDDPIAHIQTIDAFIQTPLGSDLVQRLPGFHDALMMHRQGHEQQQQEMQAKAQQANMNPFQVLAGGGGQNPTGDVEDVAMDRTPMPENGGF